MPFDDLVVVATFSNDLEADLAASWLDAEGIPHEILADDAGGMYPMLQVTRGVKLVVARADEARAKDVLERRAAEDGSTGSA